MKTLKSIFAIVITAMTFGACSNDFESDSARNAVRSRSQDEAIKIAVNAHNVFFGNQSRGTNTIAVAENGIHIVKGRSSRGLNNDTLLYVINYEDDGGFAVVSASPSTVPLIGIAEEGNYNPEQNSANSNIQFYLERICEYVGMAKKQNTSPIGSIPIIPIGPDIPPTDTIPFSNSYILASVGPHVALKWGQGAPYGNRFANGNCGSAACVAAMILTHLSWPHSLHANGNAIDWDKLNQHISNGEGCNEPDSVQVHSMIADLIYKIREMHFYHSVGDSIFYELANNDLLRGIYSNSACYETHELSDMEEMIQSINHPEAGYGRLVYAIENVNRTIGGQQYELNKYCWLVDGYKSIAYTTPNTQSVTYIHCNWANDGNGNGYFLPASRFNDVLNYDNPNQTILLQHDGEISYYVATATYLTPATGNNE